MNANIVLLCIWMYSSSHPKDTGQVIRRAVAAQWLRICFAYRRPQVPDISSYKDSWLKGLIVPGSWESLPIQADNTELQGPVLGMFNNRWVEETEIHPTNLYEKPTDFSLASRHINMHTSSAEKILQYYWKLLKPSAGQLRGKVEWGSIHLLSKLVVRESTTGDFLLRDFLKPFLPESKNGL